ncbi:hypothetical protein WMF45_12565 [Sorangium sp. So ce448]|uniref:hypothetical protein n=1 Tax=Sorangium sp. So ce448 TaxID=3133314 RepID=UPI003F609780
MTDVAYDAGSGRVLALNGGRLSTLDLASDAVMDLTSADADLGRALSLDPAGNRALSASANAISGRAVSVDATARPADASYSFIVHTNEGLSISGPIEGITGRDTASWEALALDSITNFPERRAATLALMDWASQATLEVRLAHEPAGKALAWVAEVP